MRFKLLISLFLLTFSITIEAMSYSVARGNALYLTDKIHYELDLTDAQADAVYEINLDYFLCIEGPDDIYGLYWNRRNRDLQYVLTPEQYKVFIVTEYFFKPLLWESGTLLLTVYKTYRNVGLYFYDKPSVYATYKGGNNKNANSHYKGRDFITNSKKTEPKRSDGRKQTASNTPSPNTSSSKISGTTNHSSTSPAKTSTSSKTSTNQNTSSSPNTSSSKVSGTTNHSSTSSAKTSTSSKTTTTSKTSSSPKTSSSSKTSSSKKSGTSNH